MAKRKSTKPDQVGQARTFEDAVANGDCLSDEEFERQAVFTFRTLGALLKTCDKLPPPALPPPPQIFVFEQIWRRLLITMTGRKHANG